MLLKFSHKGTVLRTTRNPDAEKGKVLKFEANSAESILEITLQCISNVCDGTCNTIYMFTNATAVNDFAFEGYFLLAS